MVLGSGNEYSDEDESSLETITSGYKEFASGSGRANDYYPFSNMNESVSEQPLSPKVAAFVGIDWADHTHKLPTDTHTSEAVNKTVDKIVKNVDGPTQMSRRRPSSSTPLAASKRVRLLSPFQCLSSFLSANRF